MSYSAIGNKHQEKVVNLFIDGEFRPPLDGHYFERLNPSTQLPACCVADGNKRDAQQMIFAATRSFESWSNLLLEDRIQIFQQVKQLLPSFSERFASAMCNEIGATKDWIHFNLKVCIDVIDAAISLAQKHPINVSFQMSDVDYQLRQPAGVCLAIAPWNAPVALGARAIFFPLIFGNTVIFKASDMSPETHILIAELLHAAGLPAGVLGVINNAPEHSEDVIRFLVSNPAIRRINFTGSSRVGRIIAGIAAENLKRCLLELGGKSPAIILKDADLEKAANAIIHGAFLNQGQLCMATDRIIVEQAIAEEFTTLLVDKAKRLQAQSPNNKDCKLGPVASVFITQHLSDLTEDALSKGARLLTGASIHGQFIDATLIDRITPMMRIYSEECFGPIAGIYPVASVDEAISLANDCEYGLAAAIFSRDKNLAQSISNRLESGVCHINSSTVRDNPKQPFGGLKASGYGRFGSDSSIDEFTELRWITIQ